MPPGGPQIPLNASQAGSTIIKRKRITQRIAVGEVAKLAGLQPRSSGLSIPSTPLPTVTMEIPTPKVAGTCEVPLAVILRAMPAEVLTADAESLAAYPEAQQGIALPLDNVLAMLPSGKVEFTLRDFSKWIPEGYTHPVANLGAAADNFVRLPLHEVVSRIPAEYLSIRADQKTIDTSVKTMADPFSEEMIRQLAAKNEAAAKAAAAAAAQPVPEPIILEEPQPESAIEAQPEAEVTSFDLPEPEPTASLEPEPVPQAPESEETAAFDISKFDFSALQDLPAEEHPPSEESPAAEAEASAALPSEPLTDFEVPPLDSAGDAAEADDLGISLKEEAPPVPPLEEEPEAAAPTLEPRTAPEVTTQDLSSLFSSALSHINKPGEEPVSEIPENVEEPEPEAMPEPELEAEVPLESEFVAPASEPAPALPPPPPLFVPPPFKAPATPPAFVPPAPAFIPPVKEEAPAPTAFIPPPEPEPLLEAEEAAPEPAPPEPAPVPHPVIHVPPLPLPLAARQKASSPNRISPLVNELLGFDHDVELKIQDIVRQISKWPDVNGCLLAGNEGLSICDTIEEKALSRKLAAFAPKVLAQCGDLTRELVGTTCRELHLPLDGETSISIFGRDSLNMVLTHGEKRLPLAYCEIIRKVLELLVKYYHKD